MALIGGRQQLWIRLLAGGTLLQLTRDDADHLFPRWAPDSNTLIYYTPAAKQLEEGTISEIGALGGWPRPVARRWEAQTSAMMAGASRCCARSTKN